MTLYIISAPGITFIRDREHATANKIIRNGRFLEYDAKTERREEFRTEGKMKEKIGKKRS